MTVDLRLGDCVEVMRGLPEGSVHCCVTSPPYFGLRDYGVAGQIGLERTPDEFVAKMVAVFREVRRVLRDDGTLWLNLGDSYGVVGSNGQCLTKGAGGLAPKQLLGMPWRVALALQADGWYLRSDIIWHKPNPMPESVTDRPTKSHEYLFLLAKSERYYFDAEAVREKATHAGKVVSLGPKSLSRGQAAGMGVKASGNGLAESVTVAAGRNVRTVWTVATQPYKGAHFATFPCKLVEPCIKAGCPEGGIVLDPFAGSGTTGAVAVGLGRSFVGVELNPAYLELARARIDEVRGPLFAGVPA
jgi:DNA modification methylase